MTLQMSRGRRRADSAEDLETWLRGLTGCPTVTETVVLSCPNHDEPATWFYVEADAAEGVARHRCLACGRSASVLDSEEHWTHPSTWSCTNCANSIVEVAVGIATEAGNVHWVAIAVRCVECGTVEGVTDMHVPGLPVGAALAAL